MTSRLSKGEEEEKEDSFSSSRVASGEEDWLRWRDTVRLERVMTMRVINTESIIEYNPNFKGAVGKMFRKVH